MRTSSESHFHSKKQFYMNSLCFRNIADFEADTEIDGSILGNKTKNIYKQNPILSG